VVDDETLAALGIARWRLREAAPAARATPTDRVRAMPFERDPASLEASASPAGPAPEPSPPAAPSRDAVTAPSPGPDRAAALASLAKRVAACERCDLATTRTQTVFGVGLPGARWMVVGEAPGAEEDRRGEPFVGRAGQLLNAMFAGIGVARDDVYIANILKCRPPNYRDPRPEEVAACREHLGAQIALVGPELVLAVGRVAAQNLLGDTAPLGRLRGRVHRLPELDLPVVVTYHPAYLLRTPRDKAKAWADLRLAAATVRVAQ